MALSQIAGWFGVDDAFTNRVALSKQSTLPLDQTIENFDEVRAALRGTRFESCLDDEPAYRAPTLAALTAGATGSYSPS